MKDNITHSHKFQKMINFLTLTDYQIIKKTILQIVSSKIVFNSISYN